jgi:hypothetical protein
MWFNAVLPLDQDFVIMYRRKITITITTNESVPISLKALVAQWIKSAIVSPLP